MLVHVNVLPLADYMAHVLRDNPAFEDDEDTMHNPSNTGKMPTKFYPLTIS